MRVSRHLEQAHLPIQIGALDAERFGGRADPPVVLLEHRGYVLTLEARAGLFQRAAVGEDDGPPVQSHVCQDVVQADPATALHQSDTWLSTEVPKILASNAYADGGVLFITWDEGESGADQVPMIIITKGITSPGYKSSVAYSHASYLATVEDIFGLPKLGAAANAPTMKEFWQ